MYFCFAIRNAYLDPGQADQQRFFLIFGISGTVLLAVRARTHARTHARTSDAQVWFLALPIIVLFSPLLPIWERLRFVVGVGLFIHTVGLSALVYVIWPNRAEQYMSLAFNDDLAGSTPYDDI